MSLQAATPIPVSPQNHTHLFCGM
uniref:Uncharacterized protein n=1 Tax=Arundo donax TaxID=35708 RepID=A0A0A8YYC6_ARUDO